MPSYTTLIFLSSCHVLRGSSETLLISTAPWMRFSSSSSLRKCTVLPVSSHWTTPCQLWFSWWWIVIKKLVPNVQRWFCLSFMDCPPFYVDFANLVLIIESPCDINGTSVWHLCDMMIIFVQIWWTCHKKIKQPICLADRLRCIGLMLNDLHLSQN